MRVILQRVSRASVTVDSKITGEIGIGFLILLGVVPEDTKEDVDWLVNKCVNMRIFPDEEGKMNLSIKEVGGRFLVVSQFTLHASTKKGNRPSFIKAARPDHAVPMYELFCNTVNQVSELDVETGIFGADMKVDLLNDGPVTIIIDSKIKE